MPRKVLVIEDDAAIRRGIVDALRFHGFATAESGHGVEGSSLATTIDCDLVLLDLVLPGRDGLQILEDIRGARPTLPVIILTARGDEQDRVAGLKTGADDYVVKPFSVKELIARAQAVLRRSPERPADLTQFEFVHGVADMMRREARFHDGGRAELSEREAELLRYLAVNANRAISREELLARVWGIEARAGETRTIDMHVARLREKLRDDSADPRIILTVRGKGYMLAALGKEPGPTQTPAAGASAAAGGAATGSAGSGGAGRTNSAAAPRRPK